MTVSISLPRPVLDRLALLGGMKRMSLIASGSTILICAQRPGLKVALLASVPTGMVTDEIRFALNPRGTAAPYAAGRIDRGAAAKTRSMAPTPHWCSWSIIAGSRSRSRPGFRCSTFGNSSSAGSFDHGARQRHASRSRLWSAGSSPGTWPSVRSSGHALVST